MVSTVKIKLLYSYPESEENLEFLVKARKEAEENSRLLTPEEKQSRAEATFRAVRKALLSGSGRIGGWQN